MNLGDIEKLENDLREQIKKCGIINAANILGVNKAYVSRIASGKVIPTVKKTIDFLEKLK